MKLRQRGYAILDARLWLVRDGLPSQHGDEWSVAFAGHSCPLTAHVSNVLATIGFALGEDIGVGLFRPLRGFGVAHALVGYSLPSPTPRSSRMEPSIPPDVSSEHLVEFVEAALRFIATQPDGPLRIAMSHACDALDGLLERQFMHAWIAAETLADWGIKAGKFSSIRKQRIADHAKWNEWVKSHEECIRRMAVSGEEQSFVDQVRDADKNLKSDVRLVFLGEGIPWTDEMTDVERVRNKVVHEGAMLGFQDRNVELDLDRIGLVRTMTTALAARLIGYSGPIADRSQTHRSVTSSAQPSWWSAKPLERHVIFSNVPVPPP